MNSIAQHTKITHTDINTLISECNNKLSLSGGDLTGRLTFKLNSSIGGALGVNTGPCLRITGGGWLAAESGAYIQLYPKSSPDASSSSGSIKFHTDNGTNYSELNIYPHNVLDYNGFIRLSSDNGTLYNSKTTTRTIIRGSTDFNTGASLYLHGKDYSSAKGNFQIYAHDGTNSSLLEGTPNGNLTWEGAPLLHTGNTNTYATNIIQNTLNNGWIEIPENADLNNYMTPGLYACQTNATVATLKNCPTTTAFELIITPRHTRQHLRHYNSPGEFVRYYQTWEPIGWSSWLGMYIR